MKIVHPGSETLDILFWISTIALACSVPLLMLSKNAFRRNQDQA